jgi:DNA-binding response OmpR family regulator
MRVLVAEDDLLSRRMIEAMLEKWGYQVTTASDGDEAWELMQAEDPPKLVILDWIMPGMEGVEVCRKVRESGRSEPTYIILLTSKGEKGDIVSGLEAGADDYIAKPYDSEELRARVQVGERVIALQTALAARVKELQDALVHIKTLQGILPICMHCHKIRNDEDAWQRLESYIQDHSEAEFSHGLCPECFKKHYPEFAPERDSN